MKLHIKTLPKLVKKSFVSITLAQITKGIAVTIITTNIAKISTVTAQIIPDNSLGSESSQVSPNLLINNPNINIITGGASRGGNLFHSFREFNVNNEQAVLFENPEGIVNILTRVMGGKATNILATLAVGGNANLFLINPNGIIFGDNASLLVSGSFIGTTANSIKFADGQEFSAVNNSPAEILTISVPVGLQFGRQPGSITSTNNLLGVFPDTTLALIGGEINLENSNLFAENGQIKLAAVGDNSLVDLQVNGSELNIKVADTNAKQAITLNNSRIIVSAENSLAEIFGGNIFLDNSTIFGSNGGVLNFDVNQLNLDQNSLILSAINNSNSGGNIQIRAKDNVSVTNQSRIVSNVNETGTGTGGDVNINARNITVAGNGTGITAIATDTSGVGTAGNLTLNATDSINLDAAFVSATTGNTGQAGNLTLQAGNDIRVVNQAILGLFTQGSGSTGDLRIETGNLWVENTFNGGGIAANTIGAGSVGGISIRARNAVNVINGSISTAVRPGSTTQVTTGDITVETQQLNIRNGSYISTNTFSAANAGNIFVRAGEYIKIAGVTDVSSISSSTGLGSSGNAGNITIQTPYLAITQGGKINAESVNSTGNTGNININAEDIEVDGFVFVPQEFLPDFTDPLIATRLADPLFQESLSRLGGIGYDSSITIDTLDNDTEVRGGTITVETERLRLSNGGNISSSVFLGRGQGGNLLIRARDGIEITGVGSQRLDGSFTPSGLIADLQIGGIGEGGNIDVITQQLNMDQKGAISASTFGQGNAGKVNIQANQINLQGNSAIRTQVDDDGIGNAGNINIKTQQLNLLEESQISSGTLGNGNGGNLTVEADQINLIGSENPLITGLFSSVNPTANGNGGKIDINTNRLTVREGAEISSSSVGNGEAGNISISANLLEINGENSAINSVTDVGNGGDINLNINNLLLLRRGGLISSTAGQSQAGGDGGNININSKFIVAFPNENSDISANAYTGRGGNINIQTQGILGIKPRSQLSNQSDITASSQLGVQGQIAISEPDVDPSQGIIELPNQIIDKSDQIGKICPRTFAEASKISQFTVTGRGSLAPSPLEMLVGNINMQNLATLTTTSTQSLTGTPTETQNLSHHQSHHQNHQIIEAQGWVKSPDGGIKLVAQTSLLNHLGQLDQSSCN